MCCFGRGVGWGVYVCLCVCVYNKNVEKEKTSLTVFSEKQVVVLKGYNLECKTISINLLYTIKLKSIGLSYTLNSL